MSWQAAWQLYQDGHPDADWYDFEAYYWGDDSEENGNEPESDDLYDSIGEDMDDYD